MGAGFRAGKFQAAVAEGRLAGQPVTLGKPLTFMNLSGGPVAGLCRYYRIPPGRLLVIHDELDIPFGTIRLKQGGGDNGHNGLRAVTASLGTREYYRLRFGIGRPPGRMDPAVFVLRDFSAAERKELPFLLDRAADAAEALLAEGLAAAQNAFHGAIPGRTAAPTMRVAALPDPGFPIARPLTPTLSDARIRPWRVQNASPAEAGWRSDPGHPRVSSLTGAINFAVRVPVRVEHVRRVPVPVPGRRGGPGC